VDAAQERPLVQGTQIGRGNEQHNFFAPVTLNLFTAGLERLRDVCFDPTPLNATDPAAFGTYLLSSVLSTFPQELLEAARMDGAGRSRILWRIVVPISRPTLTVLLVFFI
jgi:hypothetical protein